MNVSSGPFAFPALQSARVTGHGESPAPAGLSSIQSSQERAR